MIKKLLLSVGLMVSLLIVSQGSQMQAAQASVKAHPVVAYSADGKLLNGILSGYSAPRRFGQTPEQAARAGYADCPGNYFCTWHGYAGAGTSLFYPNSVMQYYAGIYLPGSGENNTGSSWYNLLGTGTSCTCTVWLYDTEYCAGWKRSLTKGAIATAQGSDWNDRVSSYSTQNYISTNCLESSPGGLYYP